MFPVLLRIGRFEIHSYGLLLALSFLIGIYWAMRRGEKRSIPKNMIMDLSLLIVIAAIVGSRLMYVLTHIDEFRGRWFDIINPIQSTGEIGIAGLTMLGGVILALITIIVFCRIRKIPILRLCDVLAPAFGLGIFLTRIGCFLNGCCYGKPCDLPWGVTFPLHSPAGSFHQGISLHPTQLYSSFYGLVITIIIVLLDRKRRFDGFLFGVFFMLYGLSRFTIDFFRHYDVVDTFTLFGTAFTFNQAISVAMLLFGLIMLIVLGKGASKQ